MRGSAIRHSNEARPVQDSERALQGSEERVSSDQSERLNGRKTEGLKGLIRCWACIYLLEVGRVSRPRMRSNMRALPTIISQVAVEPKESRTPSSKPSGFWVILASRR